MPATDRLAGASHTARPRGRPRRVVPVRDTTAFRRPEFENLNGAAGPKVRGIVFGWGRYVSGDAGVAHADSRVSVALLEPGTIRNRSATRRRYRVEATTSSPSRSSPDGPRRSARLAGATSRVRALLRSADAVHGVGGRVLRLAGGVLRRAQRLLRLALRLVLLALALRAPRCRSRRRTLPSRCHLASSNRPSLRSSLPSIGTSSRSSRTDPVGSIP